MHANINAVISHYTHTIALRNLFSPSYILQSRKTVETSTVGFSKTFTDIIYLIMTPYTASKLSHYKNSELLKKKNVAYMQL